MISSWYPAPSPHYLDVLVLVLPQDSVRTTASTGTSRETDSKEVAEGRQENHVACNSSELCLPGVARRQRA